MGCEEINEKKKITRLDYALGPWPQATQLLLAGRVCLNMGQPALRSSSL